MVIRDTWLRGIIDAFLKSVFLIFVTTFIHADVMAQSLPPGVTPAMINSANSLSEAQREALARQYGISIPSEGATSQSAPLAVRGEQLTSIVEASSDELQSDYDELEDLDESKNGEVERFGDSIFDRQVSTFAPTDDAPVPDEYRLGVGDELLVQLFGKENDELVLQIDRLGRISIPKLGSVNLAGLTFEDARDLIKSKLSKQLIGVESVISLGRLRAINVFMAGEVEVPGAYSVSALTTLSQALFQVGGVSEIGSLRRIQVIRREESIIDFDLYDLLLNGVSLGDIRLQSGDVVFVPPYGGLVTISGELKRPMRYEIVPGETVGDLVKMAGGFTDLAFPQTATLIRRDKGISSVFNIDIESGNSRETLLKDGDVIDVPRAGDFLDKTVSLAGAVVRPGNYGWSPGMRVSDLIGDFQRDLNDNVDLSLTLIVRQNKSPSDITVHAFDIGSALRAPGSESDPALQEFDEIIFFSMGPEIAADDDEKEVDVGDRETLLKPIIDKIKFQAKWGDPVRIVSISGAVKKPGTYPLVEGATADMLVRMAGGLKDSASSEFAELRRLIIDVEGNISSQYSNVKISGIGGDRKFTLRSRDHLTIREIPDWSQSEAVVVEGEVRFPGQYKITDGERLSDIVRRAGGLTDRAFPRGAIFTKASLAEREKDRVEQFTESIQTTFATRLLTEETTSQDLSEVSAILELLEENQGSGRLLIDLERALQEENGDADVVVQNGDKLSIPAFIGTVSVVGEVKLPGTYTYQRDLAIKDYVELSAGVTKRADFSEIYVIKSDGSVQNTTKSLWRFDNAVDQLEPGDTVVVPINTEYKESLTTWTEMTQIVYQSVVTLAALARL